MSVHERFEGVLSGLQGHAEAVRLLCRGRSATPASSLPGAMQGCLHGASAPQVGWPTLQLITFATELKAANVNVLGITSRKKTRLIKPAVEAETAEEAAGRLSGRICFVKYATSCTDKPD